MFFDVLLISVILMTVYVGPVLVRRRPPGHRTYGWLLVADGVAAALALYLRNTGPGHEAGNLLGVVAIGAAVFLIILPPILRDLARRAVLSDHLWLASRLIDLRELLQPGMGARREREMVDALSIVKAGKVDDAIAVLEETRGVLSDPEAQRTIDERIIFTYLSARRWQDAVATYEATFEAAYSPVESPDERALSPDDVPPSSEPDSEPDSDSEPVSQRSDAQPDEPRRPAGAPLQAQLVVEMVRAYCEVGDLDKAAQLIEGIESSALAREPLFVVLLFRARLVFLAFVGRTHAVERILAPSGPLTVLPPASRSFWSGIARLHAGDRPGARAALERAAHLARRDRRAREWVERILASLDDSGADSGAEPGPTKVSPGVAKLADRITAAVINHKPTPVEAIPQVSGVSWRRVPVTSALIASNIAVFLLVMALFGSTGDIGGLIRSGANIEAAVKAGEWWRLPSSMFLHGGVWHLLLNVYVLWALGKLVEQMYGSLRYFAVYATAGLVGALASALIGAGVSVGASGAVLGLLGALIAEFGLYRAAYPPRWRKHMFRMSLLIAVAQVALGFFYPAIDQAAHVGGLLAGAATAAAVSPRSPAGRSMVRRTVAVAFALAGILAIGYGIFGVSTTSYGDTLARFPVADHRLEDRFVVTAPAHWEQVNGRLIGDSGFQVLLTPWVPEPGQAAETVELREAILAISADAELTGDNAAARLPHRYLALPDPWQSREYELRERSNIGAETRFRAVVFARWAGDEDGPGERQAWLGVAYMPDALADDLHPTLGRILESLRRD